MNASSAKKAPSCPICGRPASPETKPFCSPRCADIDLGRWVGERYVIPGPPDENAQPAPPEADEEGTR